jgi:ribosomal protein L11 methylase PrmA
VILSILPTLVNVTCGRLILSGILETQTKSLLAGLGNCGISDVEITQDGEWVSMIT